MCCVIGGDEGDPSASVCNSKSCDLHNLSNAGDDIIGFRFTNVNSDTTHMTPTCHTALPITNYVDSFNYIIESAANYSECSQLTMWQLSEIKKKPTIFVKASCAIYCKTASSLSNT